ncbi:hypothetical protein AB833_21315 [Chromatiales bacterium (ex Bugula neritina AB1)]|nr:hypothetical protein AB833_21315 [Chromatiales bacterium (ex Bugula neritina AB1)]
MARNIKTALSMNTLGLKVELVSELRCYDGNGSAERQREIRSLADAEVERLLDTNRQHNWRAWVTYHNYYKAPDLVGFAVCRQLQIPYVLIESSIAKSRLTGPWAGFAASADAATEAADVVFYLTQRDKVALEKHRSANQRIVHLAPFLNRAGLPPLRAEEGRKNRLLAIGMHRFGDKLESYRIIADTLQYLETSDWHLSIIGDGPARPAVEALFKPFGNRVTLQGQLDSSGVAEAYRQASVFIWPGVNEAFGMVYLEAQAAGLPLVAEDRPGVRDVIASPHSLVPAGNPVSMARAIDSIVSDRVLSREMSLAGRDFIRSHHLLDTSATVLSDQLAQVVGS